MRIKPPLFLLMPQPHFSSTIAVLLFCFAALLTVSAACVAAPEGSLAKRRSTPAHRINHDTKVRRRAVPHHTAPLLALRRGRALPRVSAPAITAFAPFYAIVSLLSCGVVLLAEQLKRRAERRSARRTAQWWPRVLIPTRAALLAVLLLPLILHWRALWPRLGHFPAPSTSIIACFVIATALLALCFWRTRGSQILALLFATGVATGTLFLLLMRGEQAMSALDAGYFLGATLVFGTAFSTNGGLFRRTLFAIPPLEHRTVSPLEEPYAPGTRAQLYIVSLCVVAALALAIVIEKKSGDALTAVATLAFATSLFVIGWRSKQLGVRQVLAAFFWAALATLVLALISGLVAMPASFDIPRAMPSVSLLVITIRARVPEALPFAGGLCTALFLLHRPPAHLWTVLARAPFWGWLFVAALSVGTVATLCFTHGSQIALGICSALLPAMLFLWLEGADA